MPHGTFGGSLAQAPTTYHEVPLGPQPTEALRNRIYRHAQAGCVTCQAYLAGVLAGSRLERRRADQAEDAEKRERLSRVEHGRGVSRAADRAGLAAASAVAPFDPSRGESYADYLARAVLAKGRAETAVRQREGR